MGLTKLTGMDSPTVEIFTEKSANSDGEIITGSRVGSRLISLSLVSRDERKNREMRTIASAFFSPSQTFSVSVTLEGKTRIAKYCRLKALAMPTGSIYAPLAITASFLCPSGYLTGTDDETQGKNLNSVTPALGFPFVSVVGYGFNFGIRNFAKVINVSNTGDASTFIRAIFEVDGTDTVINPSLICGDAFVKVLTELSLGDVLVIDSELRTITLNGQNVLNLMSKDSTMGNMTLAVGENTIGFDADEHENQLRIRVYYEYKYNGL